MALGDNTRCQGASGIDGMLDHPRTADVAHTFRGIRFGRSTDANERFNSHSAILL